MFSIIGKSNVRTFTKESNFKQVYHYACLSTDNKPTTGISNGSTCFVMDSGKTYIFDEENGEWVEVEGSGGGGGGGGGDFTTAKAKVINQTEFSEGIDEMPTIAEASGGAPARIVTTCPGDGEFHDIVLYQGHAYFTKYTDYASYAVTGDCTTTQVDDQILFDVTGDFVLTISDL